MLDQERAFYAQHLDELRTKYPDKFVVIKDDHLAGAFATEDEALAFGARQFGLTPFLVRNVNQMGNIELNVPALTLGILRADPTHPIRR